MKFGNLIAKVKRFDKNAEIIFDRQEPVGIATDLVMPRRRWFRKKIQQSGHTPSLQHSLSR